MAKKHKAATSVSLASTTEETAFHTFVQRHWKNAALFFSVLAAVILVRQWLGTREAAETDASWDRLRNYTSVSFTASAASADELASLSKELGDAQAAPWAKALEVGARAQDGDYTGAEKALEEWKSGWPDHPLLAQEWIVDEDADTMATLPEIVRARTAALEAWEAQHPNVLAQPEPILPPELQQLKDQGLEVTPGGPPPGMGGDGHEGHDHGPGEGHEGHDH